MERKRDAERKAKGKGKDGAKGAGAKEEEKKKEEGGDIIHGEGMAAAAKVIERMVNQNTFNEITQDFKFWEDASDQVGGCRRRCRCCCRCHRQSHRSAPFPSHPLFPPTSTATARGRCSPFGSSSTRRRRRST